MATEFQFRGYDTATLATTTGEAREIIINTDTNQITVHDGVTPGGISIPGTIAIYATIILAKAAAGTDNSFCYVVELETLYRYEATGSAYTADDTYVLITGDAGDTRWLSVGGRYIVGTLNVKGNVSFVGKLGVQTVTPDGILDVTPDTITTTSYAYPLPRVTTTQKNALTGMTAGAKVFDITLNHECYYNGTAWICNNTAVGEMFAYDNTTATVINEADTYTFIQGILSDDQLEHFTFAAGSTGAITAWADAGGGLVRATSAGHTLAAGDQVNIDDTTNYNGTYIVIVTGSGTFDITAAWVADDAQGNFTSPDVLIAGVAAVGKYAAIYSASLTSAGSNQTYKAELVINVRHIDESACERKIAVGGDIGPFPGSCIIDIADGDRVGLQIKNIGGTSNLTMKHANVNLLKI